MDNWINRWIDEWTEGQSDEWISKSWGKVVGWMNLLIGH